MLVQAFLDRKEIDVILSGWFLQRTTTFRVADNRGTRGEYNSPRSTPPRVSRPTTPTTGTWN
jgi:hypothetical protein